MASITSHGDLGNIPKGISFRKNPPHHPSSPLISATCKPPTRSNSLQIRLKSLPSHQNPLTITLPFHQTLVLFSFSFAFLCLRLFSTALLPDFPLRWRHLVSSSVQFEADTGDYPEHLWRVFVAYEDRRFFSHFGIDVFGIGRAVLSLSALGGGSTITQQLVKNAFLKNERTISRKIVEMVLALALERRMSKQRILSSYLSKIYFGHGIYGIEAASLFYLGKHPSRLNLGESAMLAGIVPAPEVRSPLRDPSGGKTFQARVLKRMVKFGYLDIETALLIAKQPLLLRVHQPNYADGFICLLSLSKEGLGGFSRLKQERMNSPYEHIWDWEKESKIWEVREDFERWASQVHNKKRDTSQRKERCHTEFTD